MNNALQELNILELPPNADEDEETTEIFFCIEQMWTNGNFNPNSSGPLNSSGQEQTEGGNRSGSSLSGASWTEQEYSSFTEPVAEEADVNGNSLGADEDLSSEEVLFSRRKRWADEMASFIPPPGLPVSNDPADHETFMRAREEYLRRSGYYLDPYHLLQILYPETYDKVILDRIPLYNVMDEIFAFSDETWVKKENGNLY